MYASLSPSSIFAILEPLNWATISIIAAVVASEVKPGERPQMIRGYAAAWMTPLPTASAPMNTGAFTPPDEVTRLKILRTANSLAILLPAIKAEFWMAREVNGQFRYTEVYAAARAPTKANR